MGLADDTYKETDVPLPQDLFMHAAALRDGVEGMAKVETTMAQCNTQIEASRAALADVQSQFAACRTTLDDGVAAAIEGELAEVAASLDQAQSIEAAKAKAWETLQGPLRLLSGPADGVRAAMPKHNVLDAPPDPSGSSVRLEQLLSQLKELRITRLNGIDTLRKDLGDVNIVGSLAAAADPQPVLEAAMRELDTAAEPVRANLARQQQLIKDMVEANANTVQQRKFVKEHQQKQRDFIAKLQKSCVPTSALQKDRGGERESAHKKRETSNLCAHSGLGSQVPRILRSSNQGR